MNLSRVFVERPIATVLLTIGVALAGVLAFFLLPVSPLPQVDYPAISVTASLPGASPSTMASSVATPLERRLGVIAGVNELTSTSSNGSTRISLQFDLSRNIDSAAREVQAAINAAHSDRRADRYAGADVQDAHARPDLRGRVEHREPEALAGRGRGQGGDRRRIAARGARRARAVLAQPLRHQQRGRARRDPVEQRQ